MSGVILVCGTIWAADAEAAFCSQCKAAIWPTCGSLDYARANGIPMICIDCYAKIDDSIFKGFMHHGRMLPQALAEILFRDLQRSLHEKNKV